MLVQPHVSYPGVYIQEVASDIKTIAPVDTATTAFIGRAARGPTDIPMICNGYGDFERIFGGLWRESKLGYAVSDFFLNGGSKAVVVRLHHLDIPSLPTGSADGHARIDVDGHFVLKAKSPGAWGNRLAARVTKLNPTKDKLILAQLALQAVQQLNLDPSAAATAAAELFNLTVHDLATGITEDFANLSVNPASSRYIENVLKNGSDLVDFESPGAGTVSSPAASQTGSLPVPVRSTDKWETGTYFGVTIPGSDGLELALDNFTGTGKQGAKEGLYALEHADIFNMLCIPPYLDADPDVDSDLLAQAAAYCEQRRAMLLVDPPVAWTKKDDARDNFPIAGLVPSANAALFFPRIIKNDPLNDNQPASFVPSGAIAGVMARTDAVRGVWKAAAGLEAGLRGVVSLAVPLTDAENGELNPLGINCLRAMPAAGNIIWGARTMVGDDRLADQWKYIPVRRTALFIEESLYRGTQWAVFEPNDEPLWSQLRLNIGVFMQGLFRQGAFQGSSPKDAYLVKCDASTTTQADIDRGIVNMIVGFAPLKPAEFVILYIQQIAGNLAA